LNSPTDKTKVNAKKVTYVNDSWTQTYYDLIRNGHVLGSVFDKNDGTVSYEPDKGKARNFPSLEKAIEAASKTKVGLIEQLRIDGIS